MTTYKNFFLQIYSFLIFENTISQYEVATKLFKTFTGNFYCDFLVSEHIIFVTVKLQCENLKLPKNVLKMQKKNFSKYHT